jgi:DNA-binding transcriptional LysR family regulator
LRVIARRPAGPLVSDNSEAVLFAAIAGITLIPDWLAGAAIRAGKLVEVVAWMGWEGGWRGLRDHATRSANTG